MTSIPAGHRPGHQPPSAGDAPKHLARPEQHVAEQPMAPDPAAVGPAQPEGEQGGPQGPEPTRFGDWEKNGRCFDF
jgi:hypothetical protein